MGILDWLTEGVGSSMGGSGMGEAGAMPSMPPMPPVQQPGGAPVPPMSPPGGTPPMPPAGAEAPPPPPVPLPAPRPADAPLPPTPPGPAPAPPAPAPTSGAGMPPAPPSSPMSLAPAAPGPTAEPGNAMIGGGMDQNKMRSVLGALGGGLKAAGNSAGKSPFQAFASGAGEGLESGQKSSDTGYDQRLKSLQLAVNAQAAGDKSAYNKNYAEYLKGKLENDAAAQTPGGKKGSAWNKPDSQKFIDAQNALAKDPEIHASSKLLEQLSKTGNEADIAAATQQHNALIQKKQGMYLTGVGLNPQTIAANFQNPPGTPQNPHVVTSKSDFDNYVKPGQAYKNPADGKIYIRKGEGGKQGQPGGDQEASPQQTAVQPGGGTPPLPPGPRPNTMGGPAAEEEE